MESAAPTFMRTFGFHPLLAFVDRGPGGAGGELLAGLLRLGNANTTPPQAGGTPGATDHISVLDMALAQLPGAVRSRVVVRADSGGGTKAFLTRITNLGSGYSIGIGTAIGVDQQLLTRLPTAAWTQAYDPDRKPAGRRAGHRADRDAALADRPRLAAISARATQHAVHAPAWALHDRVRS